MAGGPVDEEAAREERARGEARREPAREHVSAAQCGWSRTVAAFDGIVSRR